MKSIWSRSGWVVVAGLVWSASAQAQESLYDYAATLTGAPGVLTNYSIDTKYATGIPVEFVRLVGNQTINANTSWGSVTADAQMLMVRVEGDLTIQAGCTLTAAARKRGMVILVSGDVNVGGTVSMTARGAANVAGQKILLLSGTGQEYQVPAGGGTGGAAVSTGGTVAGNPGVAGSNGGSGGGGGGAAKSKNGYSATSGAGTQGTSYSGGTGGGGANYRCTAQAGTVNGGKGGNASGYSATSPAGGGGGNPGGTSVGTSTPAGADGTGGLLVLFAEAALTIQSSASILSQGGSGGGVTGAAGGGGSGGGSIQLFHRGVLSNSGTISASGGAGGTGSAAGGTGGSGSVRISLNDSPVPVPPSISGRVIDSITGEGIAGVLMGCSEGGNSSTTIAGGYYTNVVSHGWSGTVTPVRIGGSLFTPVNRGYTNVQQDITGEDYLLDARLVATGGTITDVAVSGLTYRVHAFTNIGTDSFEVLSGVCGGIECLLVGGGGGGGGAEYLSGSGGGGAGGLVYSTILNVAVGEPIALTVGSGGIGGVGGPAGTLVTCGTNGGNSIFGSLSATGGGGGGSGGGDTDSGTSGGSGGGGGVLGTSSAGGSGVAGQGCAGGNSCQGGALADRQGGGGGGAGGAGESGVSETKGGDGGNGLYFGDRFGEHTGASGWFAGGGGGGTREDAIGSGKHGGGDGNGSAGSSNTGGGGGGNGIQGNGGTGGSGIVLVRYAIQTRPISGRVTDVRTGEGLDGMTVAFSDGGSSATTSGGGYYTNAVPVGWSGTATPLGSPAADTNVVLLLKMNGAGSTMADSSTFTRPVAAYGNATQSTNRSKFGEKSLYLDGSGDYITVPNSSDFDFGADDFTIDFWMYPNTTAPEYQELICKALPSSLSPFSLILAGNTLIFVAADQSGLALGEWNVVGVEPDSSYSLAAGSIQVSQWQHVAVTRCSSSFYIFVNGQLRDTHSDGSAFGVTEVDLYVGRTGNATDPCDFSGYIDELRISKGVARWTSDFTVPTNEYASAGSSGGAGIFVPTNRVYSNVTNEYTGQNYAQTTSFTISGQVRWLGSGVGASNLVVVASEGTNSCQTDADGRYELQVVPGWSGTVEVESCSAQPVSRTYESVMADASQQDFTVFGTGGVITSTVEEGVAYGIHIYTNNGIFTTLADYLDLEYLVVGGGGAGGRNIITDNRGGGGGGAGGLLTGVTNLAGGGYAVLVGAGGVRSSNRGGSGTNSSFAGIVAIGGGGGGGANSSTNGPTSGLSGGSGGGGGNCLGIGGEGIPGQGFGGGYPGGTGTGGGGGGGGGGASSAGTSGNGYVSGIGGAGLSSTISGEWVTYATGGNGGSGNVNRAIADALANTGDGGHGNREGNPGNGGSGIVIVRFPLATERHQIVGRVTHAKTGAGIDGVPVLCSGLARTIVTTNGGYYQIEVFDGWSGTVTPWLASVGPFNPGARTYSHITNDYSGQDYVWTPPVQISGRIIWEGSGTAASNVWVAASGGGSNDLTDANGQYVIDVPEGWNGTVEVESASSLPLSRSYESVISMVTNQNFTVFGTGGVVTSTVVEGVTYGIHVYTNNGTFTTRAIYMDAEYLVVGGGGAGGRNTTSNNRGGGGGGAGGMLEGITDLSLGSYAVVVGAGGIRSSSMGGAGQNSSFADLTAIGGGGGGGATSNTNGLPGGSGGGAGNYGGTIGIGTDGQGYGGGLAGGSTGGCGGGGGGAGGAGSNASGLYPGSGGPGRESSLNGEWVTYAAGGAGGPEYLYNNSSTTDALPNTGNGGHGNRYADAGNGGNGIVIVRIPLVEERHQIGGRVTHGITGAGVDGVTVSWSGLARTATTTNGGYYQFEVHEGWSGTATPFREEYGLFTPTNRFYGAVTNDLSGQNFTWAPAPEITSITPSEGLISGGTVVTIAGENFSASPLPTVTFGGANATSVTWMDADTLQVTTPRNTPGWVDVSVVNPNGLMATQTNAFCYTHSSLIVATGGTITEAVDQGTVYRVHTFTTNGIFEVLSGMGELEYLAVGGGGGGGGIIGGGGGGGGVRTGLLALESGEMAIAVGTGGIGGTGYNTTTQQGERGGDSSLADVVALGGGGGGPYGGNTVFSAEKANGGSGGGRSAGGVIGYGTEGQGHNGGTGSSNNGGGGGGGGGTGGSCASGVSGNGGIGASNSITGIWQYYGGGGGGGTRTGCGTVGSGGLGGGGNGTNKSVKASDGVAQTGGGGGGAGYVGTSTNVLGGTGGSGIVIVRYSIEPLHEISGRVIHGATGEGLEGVELDFGAYTITTTNGGYYTHAVGQGWSGTVTPSGGGGFYSPTNRSYGNVTNDWTGQSYAWIPPPEIDSVAPEAGSMTGGTTVFITGSYFSASPLPTVTFGGSNALNVARINATTLSVVTPAHAVGDVDVVVANPHGQSATLANGFRYMLPPAQVLSIEPGSGPTTGGTVVVVSGTNFSSGLRRSITATNGGAAQTNFEVPLTMNTAELVAAGKLRTDGGDLRFWDSDGTSAIPYWVESGMNGTATKIWVRIQELPAGAKTLYVSYGNPALESQSSGDDVFMFYDGFDGAALDAGKWSPYVQSSGSIALSGGVATLSAGGTTGGAYYLIVASDRYDRTVPQISEVRHNVTGNYRRAFEAHTVGYANNAFQLYRDKSASPANADLVVIGYQINGTWGGPSIYTASPNTWYVSRLIVRTGGQRFEYLNESDGVLASYDCSNPVMMGNPWSYQILGTRNVNGPSQIQFDWYRLRKYAATMPTATVNSVEETLAGWGSGVVIGGVTASLVSASADHLTVLTPAHAGGFVDVTLVGGGAEPATLSNAFFYLPVIAGRVTNRVTGAGVEGAVVTLSGGAGSATTGTDGLYSLTVSDGWSGMATVSLDPALGAGSFAPASRVYSSVTDTQAGQDYSFVPENPTIAGRVVNEDTGEGIEGAVVMFSGGAGSVTTDTGGYFSKTVPYLWTGTATPSHTNAYGAGVFTPGTRGYTNLTASLAEEDFSWKPPYVPGNRYVSLTGLNEHPYTNWVMAARDIQTAVNAAGPGDTIYVADGTYNLSSVITVGKPVTIVSENGPLETIVRRASGMDGVFNLTVTNALLEGFTVREGYAFTDDETAGGVGLNQGAVIRNCIVEENTSMLSERGGGLTLRNGSKAINCVIRNNNGGRWVRNAGGVLLETGSRLINCTVYGNYLVVGGGGGSETIGAGGVWQSQSNTAVYVENCIVASNIYSLGSYWHEGVLTSHAPDLFSMGHMVARRTCYGAAARVTLEDGCFSMDPGLQNAPADLRLREDSICVNYGAGTYNELATDLEGNARVSGGEIDLGAHEFVNPRPRVMGRVTHEDTGAGVGGVTLGLSDGAGSATTAGNGYYARIVESGWNGTATPSYGSGSFTNPALRAYAAVTADQRGQNYVWTPPDPVVSGRVTHQRTGAGVDGVTLSFDGLPDVVTAGGGAYSFTAPRHASGTLTPQSAEGGGFIPATRSYSDLRMNQATQHFAWVPPTRAISGRVVNHYTGAGVEGATVSFSADGGASVTTDAGGYYTGQVYYGWTGRATPAKTGGTFTPTAYREYAGVTAAQTGQDYIWLPATPAISGRVTNTITGAGMDGVTVSFTAAGSTVTSNGGWYSRTMSYGWSGTATPSHALGVLAPTSRTYENLTESTSSQHFGWTPPERTIAGRVTDGDTGQGLDGLAVGFSSGGGSATTASGGYYTRTLYYGWIGSGIVSRAGGAMVPAVRQYSGGLWENQTGQDFVWRTNRWISGVVTNIDTGAGVDGIMVSFSSGAGSTVTTNGGNFRQAVTYNWSGTATPSGGGATFTPSARSFSGVISDRSGENYAYKVPRTISGRVTNHYTGVGVDGIVVDFGGAGQATTVYGGYYSRTVPDGWSGTAVPQGVGIYVPASRAYTAIAADVSGQDYEWTTPDPVVSGRVAHRYTGAGIGGLTVMFTAGAGSATTAGDGTFSRTVAYGWSGTISVSCETGSMLPSSRMLGNVTSHLPGQDFAWDPPTVPICGVVTNADTGSGEEGVTINFSGGAGSTISGSGGGYTQQVYVGWSGTATVVKAGGTLSPTARSYANVSGAQANQHYLFYPNRTISGRVLMEDTDEGVEGVSIQLSGGTGTVVTDGGGYYVLEVVHGWSGTATALAGTNAWVYEPATCSFSGVSEDLTGQDFRVRQQRRIAGQVTDLYSGEGVNGVVLTNVTSRGWTSTAGGGSYELWVRNGWSGRIEARHTSGSFVLVGRNYDVVAEDLVGQNYVWIPPTPVVSGRVTNLYSGAGVAGVAVSFSDGAAVTSAVNGTFSRSVPRGWSGTLSPSLGSEMFQPSSRTLTNVLADAGGQNFGWMADRIAVSGRVTNTITGVGMAGVVLTASGGMGSAATTADGSYSLSVDYWWSGSVQPSFAGGTFMPGSRSYTSLTSAQEAQDYGWAPPASGGDRYVSLEGTSVYPYTNWTMAATNLQWAINAANAGENVWVAGGTYGVASPITVGKAIWVRSVDGAQSTVLERSGVQAGELLHVNHANAKVSGFTLQGGDPDAGGDGAYVQSGYLYNAIVRGHESAGIVLGDVPTARIANCLVVDNAGAGLTGHGVVVNCTVVDNGGSLTASLIYNTIADTSIVADEVRFSLAPGLAGSGNQSADPLFVNAASGDYHLQAGSPAVDRGNNFYNTLSEDLEGNPRILNAIDLGVYETKGTEGLSVALMAEPSPVIGGDGMEYVVWAFNSGPGAATGVEVEVGVPASMTYLGHTDGMTYQSAGALWTIGNLSPGAHRVMRIEAQTGAAGWVTNVARISALSADPSTPGYDVATNVLEVLGPVQITNVLAGSSSGNATVQWNSVVGQGYDVYVVSGTPTRGASVTFEKQETGLVVTDNLRDYLDDSLGEGEVQRYYQVSYEDRSPETNNFWGVIRKDIAPGFTMLSPAVRTDRRFDGELGEMLAESLTGSASADGDKVFILTEGMGWRTLWLDADKTWREQDGQPSACVLPEGQGLYLLRSVPSSTKVTFRGPVGNDGTGSVALQPGFNLIGLSEGWKLPLKATLATANPQGGAWEEEADQLVIQQSNGSWRFLMFVTNWGAPYDGNWFDLNTYQIVGPSETLDPGAAYYYLRQGEATDVEF